MVTNGLKAMAQLVTNIFLPPVCHAVPSIRSHCIRFKQHRLENTKVLLHQPVHSYSPPHFNFHKIKSQSFIISGFCVLFRKVKFENFSFSFMFNPEGLFLAHEEF